MRFKRLKKINEIGRVITNSPTEIGGSLQSRLVPEISNDRTNLNNEDTLKILLDLAIDDDKSISFVNKYDDKTPRLGVNPTVQYDTPHGIYSYPFNKQTLINMIYTGSPTEATFATNYDFIHIFKTSDTGKVKIKDDFSTNAYSSYNNKAKYQTDLKQIIKTSIIFAIDFYNESIKYRFSDLLFTKVLEDIDLGNTKEEKIYSLEKLLNVMIYNIRTLSASSDIKLFKDRYSKLLAVIANLMHVETADDIDDALIKKETGLINFYTEKLLPIVDSLATKTLSTYRSSNDKVKSIGGLFYKIYYICFVTSKTLCDLTVMSRENESGSYFTLLLDLIGIKSVDDYEGSATIHPNEPTQSFAAGYGPETQYELLGTFNNIFKLRTILVDIFNNLLIDEKISNEYAEFSSSIITIEKISKIKNIESIKKIISQFKKNTNKISDFFYKFFQYNKNELLILNDLYDYIMNDLKMPKLLFSINAFQIIRKDKEKINKIFDLLIRYKSEIDVYDYFSLLTTVVDLNFNFLMFDKKQINNLNIENQRRVLDEFIFFIKTSTSYSDLAFDYYKKFMLLCDLNKDEIFDSIEELETYFRSNPTVNQRQKQMIESNYYEKLKYEILLNSSKIEINDQLYNLIINYLTEEMTYKQLYRLIFWTQPPPGKELKDVIKNYENPSFIKRVFNDDNFKKYIEMHEVSVYIDIIKDDDYYQQIIDDYLNTINDDIKISDFNKIILLLDSNNTKALNIIKKILHSKILVEHKDIYSSIRYFSKLIRDVINNVKNKSIVINILSQLLNCDSDDFKLYMELNLYTILNFATSEHEIIDFYKSFELKTIDPIKKKFLKTLIVTCVSNSQLVIPMF